MEEKAELDDPDFVKVMQEKYGSVFASCICGRKTVLLYRKSEYGTYNDAKSDRYTLHDTPERIACSMGGKFVPTEFLSEKK